MKQKIKNFFAAIGRFLNCATGLHAWTNPLIERDYKVDKKMIEELGVIKTFAHDTTMYCKHCGYIPKISLDWRRKLIREAMDKTKDQITPE